MKILILTDRPMSVEWDCNNFNGKIDSVGKVGVHSEVGISISI